MGKTDEGYGVDGGEHCPCIGEATGGPAHSHSSRSELGPQQELDQHNFCSYPRDRLEVNA